MTDPQYIDLSYLLGIAQNTALWGYIDQLNGLSQSRVWIMSALNDTVVAPGVVKQLANWYHNFLSSSSSQLKTVFNHTGEHAQLTSSFGNPCTFLGEPYINQCDYDAAGDSLQWLYRNTLTPPDADFARAMGAAAVGGAVQASAICALAPGSVPMGTAKKASSTSASASSSFTASQVPPCADEVVAAARSLALPASIAPRSLRAGSNSLALAASGSKVAATPILRAGNGSLYEFNQGLFVDGGGWDSTFGIAQFAYTYIPDACLASAGAGAAPAGGCLLHAVFHGCEQTLDDIGHTFMTGSNYIPWAQANNMVLLFPQAISNALNPKGCFDWWGFTGTAYASNWGLQPLTFKRILDVLMGNAITPNRTSTTTAVAFEEDLARLGSISKRA